MLNFDSQVDSVALFERNLVVGLSNLEGNIWDGSIKVIDAEMGTEKCSANVSSGITCVRFLGKDGRSIIAAKDDGCISIFMLDVLREVSAYLCHDDIISTVAADTNNESHFYSAGWDGNICYCSASSSGSPISIIRSAHAGHINDIANVDTLVVSVGDDGYVRTWDLRQSTKKFAMQISSGQTLSCVSWYQSNGLCVGTDTGNILAFDIRSSRPVNSINSQDASAQHCQRVRRITSHSSFPSLLLSASDDATVCIKHVELDSSSDLPIGLTNVAR